MGLDTKERQYGSVEYFAECADIQNGFLDLQLSNCDMYALLNSRTVHLRADTYERFFKKKAYARTHARILAHTKCVGKSVN